MSFIYDDLKCVGYLLFKNIKILNANAISSPLTYGFPAITGFTGATHALSRKIAQIDELNHIRLDGVLIACLDCTVRAYRENAYKEFLFIQSRNPILKTGKTAPIIEEGKCHLTVSLMMGVYTDGFLSEEEKDSLKNNALTLLQQQRLAGGSVIEIDKFNPVQFIEAEELNNFTKQLLPAFVLMDAHRHLIEITEQLKQTNPNATALDALIETAVLHHHPDDIGQKWQTTSVKQGRGWLVPMPVGYQGISPVFEAGQMASSRNLEYQSQYVESIYSLGEWCFPHRIDDLEQAFWYQVCKPEQNLYVVAQKS